MTADRPCRCRACRWTDSRSVLAMSMAVVRRCALAKFLLSVCRLSWSIRLRLGSMLDRARILGVVELPFAERDHITEPRESSRWCSSATATHRRQPGTPISSITPPRRPSRSAAHRRRSHAFSPPLNSTPLGSFSGRPTCADPPGYPDASKEL